MFYKLKSVAFYINFLSKMNITFTTYVADYESSDTLGKLEEFERSREKEREELLQNAAINENDDIPAPGGKK